MGVDSVIVTEAGRPARSALWQAIADAQHDDPLAPVTVAVPTSYAGLSLRQGLAARSGLVNVHFVVLHRLAELLGAPLLSEGRRPLTAALATEATRLAVREANISGLEPTSRTIDAIVATLREAIRSGVNPSGALGTILRAGRRRLSSYYDDEDQLHEAARAVEDRVPALDDLGGVIWYLPQRISPGAAALARALDRAGRLTVIASATGDPTGDRVLGEVAGALDAPVVVPAAATRPTASGIVVAPDHDTEVRAVASEVLRLAATGTPFHRVAVTFTASEPYHRLIHERFDAVGIPMAGPASRRLAETAAGRVLLGIFRVIESDLSRDAVIDLLACSPLRPDLATADTVGRWDLVTRRAGIVRGLEEWVSRLGAWSTRHDDDASAPDDAAALGALVRRLVPDTDGWQARAMHADAVLDALLGRGDHLPAQEGQALDDVRSILRSLGRLDELGGDAEAFDHVVVTALDTPFGRVGTFGAGALVAPMASLVGLELDAVFVLGLHDGATGTAMVDDPLLPGHGLARDRHDRRRAAYLGALAAAPRRVLSVPRADVRAERATMPGAWLVESASALAGRPIASTELFAPAHDLAFVRTIASLEALVATSPPGPDEAHLGTLVGWRAKSASLDELPYDDPALRLGLHARRARAGTMAGPWDGVVGALDGLAPDDERPSSATRLEVWATCPFRYFLRTVLGAVDEDRPEDLDRIEPRVRGALVHDALREFLARHVDKAPDEGWSAEERAELLAIVERHADDAATRGLVGRPALWAIDRRRIIAGARAFLDADTRVRAERGVSPWLQEVGFGDGEGDRLAPLDLDLGGRRVRFRGRIDRIDRSPDGDRVEVYDYKTGRPATGQLDDDVVASGALLQPVLYAMVARREAPDARVGSHYWYTQAPGSATLDGLDDVDDHDAARLRRSLVTMTDAIAQGVFPRDPGDDEHFGPAHCRYCEFDRACPQDRVRSADARYDGDPAFAPLRLLREDMSERREAGIPPSRERGPSGRPPRSAESGKT